VRLYYFSLGIVKDNQKKKIQIKFKILYKIQFTYDARA